MVAQMLSLRARAHHELSLILDELEKTQREGIVDLHVHMTNTDENEVTTISTIGSEILERIDIGWVIEERYTHKEVYKVSEGVHDEQVEDIRGTWGEKP